jgi:hypothetical protein
LRPADSLDVGRIIEENGELNASVTELRKTGSVAVAWIFSRFFFALAQNFLPGDRRASTRDTSYVINGSLV